MKNRLLPLLVVLGGYSAYSQVGIGVGDNTKIDPSSMLDIRATNDDGKDQSIRGMLIPRVALTGSTDVTTITNKNVNSLLVFNTETISDITPGYYYWYDNKWHRMVTSDEVAGGLNVASGDGAPGKKGDPGYPGEGVTFYTDNITGTIYMQNTDGTWTQLSGKPGTTGAAGIDGVPGVDGKVGAGVSLVVDKKTGIVYILNPGSDPAKPENWIPLNGKNGNNGKDGIVGGEGAPGTTGASGINAESTIYLDTKTGTVYILTPGTDPLDPANWVAINGKDGIPGTNGAPGTAGSITTLDAIVKDPNGDIYAYVGDDKTVAGRDAEWESKSPNWVKINGSNGKDGIVGGEGAPGTTGASGINAESTIYVDTKTGTVYILTPGTDPLDPKNWVEINGKDGIPGTNGAPGTAGSITTLDAIVKDPNGDIYAYVGDDKTVAGRDAEWASKSPNWVKINGLNGENGIAGATGAPGTAGSITTLDAIVKDPNGDIYAYVGDDKTVAGRDAEWASKSPNWVKINGNNGKDGIVGGEGAPGTTGASGINAESTIYVDTKTGTVYILTPGTDPLIPTNWVPINTSIGIGNAGDVLTTKDGEAKWVKPTFAAGDITSKADLTSTSAVLTVSGTGATLTDATIGIVPSTTAGDVLTTKDGEAKWVKPSVDAGDITTKSNLGTTTPPTVLSVTGSAATLAPATVNIVPSAAVGEVLTTISEGVVGWKAPEKANVMKINIIKDDYAVTETDYTVIARNLTKDITITLPDAAANTGRILVINQLNTLAADGVTAVKVKFSDSVIYSDAEQHAYIAASIFGGATSGSAKVTLQSDGLNWYVITYTM